MYTRKPKAGVREGREGSREAPEVEFERIPRAGGERGDSRSPREGATRNTGREMPPQGGDPPTESHAHGFIKILTELRSQKKCVFNLCFLTPQNLFFIHLHQTANSLRTKTCVLFNTALEPTAAPELSNV